MKVQTVIPYRVSQLQRYGVKISGNVTSVYTPLHIPSVFVALVNQHENLSGPTELFRAGRQTGRRTDRYEAGNSRFSQFCERA
jgi:hypothetical protein